MVLNLGNFIVSALAVSNPSVISHSNMAAWICCWCLYEQPPSCRL